MKRGIEKDRLLLMKWWICLTDTRVDGDGENDMEGDPNTDLSGTDLLLSSQANLTKVCQSNVMSNSNIII